MKVAVIGAGNVGSALGEAWRRTVLGSPASGADGDALDRPGAEARSGRQIRLGHRAQVTCCEAAGPPFIVRRPSDGMPLWWNW